MIKRFLFLFISLFAISVNLPAFAAEEQIDSLLWEASASNGEGGVMKAIDGDMSSRWDSGKGQSVGMWFQVDMGETWDVSRVEVDSTGSNNDFAKQYALSVSQDGKTWQNAANGKGELVTKITLPKPQTCRYLRISIPDGSPLAGGFWSIHEIRLFGNPPFGHKALPRPAIKWRVITPTYPTRDTVIAAYSITDFGIDPAKDEDATQAIRLATKLLSKAGGGTLWLPAGHYRLSEPIVLNQNVTIRGDWAAPGTQAATATQTPTPAPPANTRGGWDLRSTSRPATVKTESASGGGICGTVLELTANKGNPDGAPAISLANASAVIGVNFWYPEQDAANIIPYPVAVQQIGGVGMGLENVTFVNAYRGFACGPSGCALFFARNVYGTVLETGVEIDGTSDIGRLEHVRFSPNYWANSGLPKSPALNGPHAAWMLEHGTGVVMRRNDWSYTYDIQLEGYNIGFHSMVSKEPGEVAKGRKNYPNGTNGNYRIIGCRTGIQLENFADVGAMFHDVTISGAENGVVTEPTFKGLLQVQNSTISASKAAIQTSGSGHLLFTSCTLNGSIDNPSAYLSLAGCKSSALANDGKSIGVGQIKILPAPETPVMTSKVVYQTPTERYAAPTSQLAVVTDPAYGAKGDAANDDTAAVKKAIAEMAKEGGTVFFPAGEYRITSELVVPGNVELRGVNESPHHAQTRGSVIDVIPGKGNANGTPFITLMAKSGLRGLTFHYPELDVMNYTPYPWTVRANGADIWVVNTTCTFSHQFLDFATNRCDRHYIDYAAGHAFKTAFAVGGGSVGGRLINCQLNPNYYAFTRNYNNSPDNIRKLTGKTFDEYFAATDNIAKEHEDAFWVGDCSDEMLFHNFVFGARRGLVLSGSTTGPSGWCFGHGSDQSGWGLYVEKVGPDGMPLINSQLVTVGNNGAERGYIKLDPAFTGTVSCIGVDAWGGPNVAVSVEGGHLNLDSLSITQSGNASFVLRNKGSASISSAVLRNPGVVVDRSSSANNITLSGILVTNNNNPYFADDLNKLAEDDLSIITQPGSSLGIDFPVQSLSNKAWKARASVKNEDAAKAIDGDPSTRWTTGRGAKKGDDFIVELDETRTISKVRIETLASGNDYPRRFRLYLSTDGRDWGQPVIIGRGSKDISIGFKPQQARFIRIVNTNEGGGFWSIHEIQIAQ